VGIVSLERKIHFNYTPEFVEHWNEQNAEFKELCDTVGRPHGFSGQNIFYIFYLLYHGHREAGIDQKYYERKP